MYLGLQDGEIEQISAMRYFGFTASTMHTGLPVRVTSRPFSSDPVLATSGRERDDELDRAGRVVALGVPVPGTAMSPRVQAVAAPRTAFFSMETSRAGLS
jgi:hypothetical protein